ncbi:MAG: dephospho-CoA kinase [Ferrimicrobium sp.]
MRRVVVTGSIGSGKSSVVAGFAELGADVVSADEVARDLVHPDSVVLRQLVERFGDSIVDDDGVLQRSRLAAIVFDDDCARCDLNAIMHPVIRREIGRRVKDLEVAGSEIVILEIPLYAESTENYEADDVIAVIAAPEVVLGRLITNRGMTRDEAVARLVTQASDEARIACASIVLQNDGSLEELQQKTAAVWQMLTRSQ